MQKKLYVMIAAFMLMISSAVAQVTTSSVSGKVTSGSEDIIGATIKVVHEPSGTVYRAVTNQDGRYSIQGMRPGGPYNVEISDRKSTRLNSSHQIISYAVFCLKKKK